MNTYNSTIVFSAQEKNIFARNERTYRKKYASGHNLTDFRDYFGHFHNINFAHMEPGMHQGSKIRGGRK